MNHPTQEQWMDYLYDEMSSASRNKIDSHLTICGPCRTKREELQGAARALDEWHVEVPPRGTIGTRWQPVVKWAAAAVLLVSTAFATGRMSRTEIDLASLEAQISKPLEEKLQSEIQSATQKALTAAEEQLEQEIAAQIAVEMAEQMAARMREATDKAIAQATANAAKNLETRLEQWTITFATLRDEDKKAASVTLREVQQQWLAELRSMRVDLERVAVFSDESFRSAQAQFVQLAGLNKTAE